MCTGDRRPGSKLARKASEITIHEIPGSMGRIYHSVMVSEANGTVTVEAVAPARLVHSRCGLAVVENVLKEQNQEQILKEARSVRNWAVIATCIWRR